MLKDLKLIDATRQSQPLAPWHEAFRVGVGVETESFVLFKLNMLSRLKHPECFTWPLSISSHDWLLRKAQFRPCCAIRSAYTVILAESSVQTLKAAALRFVFLFTPDASFSIRRRQVSSILTHTYLIDFHVTKSRHSLGNSCSASSSLHAKPECNTPPALSACRQLHASYKTTSSGLLT
jgi:hypothetical protein